MRTSALIAAGMVIASAVTGCVRERRIEPPEKYLGGGGLAPNSGFESGEAAPDDWELTGGQGAWMIGGHSGRRAVSVTGDGNDCSYWRCDRMALLPKTTYRITCRMKKAEQTSSGCAIVGPYPCNRDFSPSDKWQECGFVFATPESTEGIYVRLGQWHVNGTLLYDDVQAFQSLPVHSKRGKLVLGEGERIESGVYTASHRLNGEGSNYCRCLHGHTVGFNSNRWTFSGKSNVVYRHSAADLPQRSASVDVSLNYYQDGELTVQASRDGREWRTVGALAEGTPGKFALPSDLFPAREIYVRLSTGEVKPGSMQVTAYTYEARLAERVEDFTGATYYFDLLHDNGRVKLAPDSAPSLEVEPHVLSGSVSAVAGAAGLEYPLEVILETSRDGAPPSRARKRIEAGAGETAFALPFTVGSVGDHRLLLYVVDAKGRIQSLARGGVCVPTLLASDYGYLIDSAGDCDLWWCESTYKVSRTRPAPKVRSAKISISAAKDEYEPFQLAIRPRKSMRDVSVEVSDLRGPSGALVPSSEVAVDLVEWHYVQYPSDDYGCVGWWPDALPHYEGPFDAESGRNRVVWFTVHVPRDARAGAYSGSITLKADGGWTASVPLELRVFDFAMPLERHVFGVFGMSLGNIRRYHNLETAEEVRQVWHKYMENAAAHRLGPYDPMALDPIRFKVEGSHWQGGNRVRNQKASGEQSLFIEDQNDRLCVQASCTELIPVDPKAEYRFSWKTRTAKAGQEYLVTLQQYDGSRNWIPFHNMDIPRTGTGQWKSETYDIVGRLAEATRYVSIVLRPALWTEEGEKTGNAWFDDLSLRKQPDGPELVADPGFEATMKDMRVGFEFGDFDKSAELYLDRMRFARFRLRIHGLGSGTFHSRSEPNFFGYGYGTPQYDSLMKDYLGGIQSHLEEKGWLGKEFIYWFDEPQQRDYEFVKRSMGTIKRFGPRLTRMLTEEPVPELFGSVDLWCPLTGSFDHDLSRQRQKSGEHVMWYICTGPKAPFAGLFIDHPAVDLRIWLWQTFQYDVEGLLVWESTYWTSSCAYPEPNAQNPWEDPMAYVQGYSTPVGVRRQWGNGDGRFLYPPNRKGVGCKEKFLEGPVNSIRWEMLREGVEDFEYLWMLREQVRKLRKAGVSGPALDEAEELIRVPEEISTSLTEFTLDPQPIFRRRAKVAEALERLVRMELEAGR